MREDGYAETLAALPPILVLGESAKAVDEAPGLLAAVRSVIDALTSATIDLCTTSLGTGTLACGSDGTTTALRNLNRGQPTSTVTWDMTIPTDNPRAPSRSITLKVRLAGSAPHVPLLVEEPSNLVAELVRIADGLASVPAWIPGGTRHDETDRLAADAALLVRFHRDPDRVSAPLLAGVTTDGMGGVVASAHRETTNLSRPIPDDDAALVRWLCPRVATCRMKVAEPGRTCVLDTVHSLHPVDAPYAPEDDPVRLLRMHADRLAGRLPGLHPALSADLGSGPDA